jgi:excisionase family DNA binding protein
MTLTQAAALLGVTAATLRQQIANGRLRARKLGRDWIVTRREIERYRQESRRHS